MLSAGMIHIWTEYKEMMKERDELNNKIISFEIKYTEKTMLLQTKEKELDAREESLKKNEKENEQFLATLQKKASDYDAAFEKLKKAQSFLGSSQRQKEIEDRISVLMSQFSDMGVDLNAQISCNDIDARNRFNSAKAKYTEIYTLAEANGLTERFNNFFFHNGQHTVYFTCAQ